MRTLASWRCKGGTEIRLRIYKEKLWPCFEGFQFVTPTTGVVKSAAAASQIRLVVPHVLRWTGRRRAPRQQDVVFETRENWLLQRGGPTRAGHQTTGFQNGRFHLWLASISRRKHHSSMVFIRVVVGGSSAGTSVAFCLERTSEKKLLKTYRQYLTRKGQF